MLSADGLPTCLIVTRSGILTRTSLHRSFRYGFAADVRRSPTTRLASNPRLRHRRLVPFIIGAGWLDQ